MSEEVDPADFLRQHGFRDLEHFNAVRESLHNRGVLDKSRTAERAYKDAIPVIAMAYRNSAKKGSAQSKRDSNAERPVNITMATGKVRPRAGENQDSVWAVGEGYAKPPTDPGREDTGARNLAEDTSVGLMRLDNPEQFWSRPASPTKPHRFPLVDTSVSALNTAYETGLQKAKEDAAHAHKQFIASKVNTQGLIDHATRLYNKHQEMITKRRSGGVVTNADLDTARLDYHDARRVALTAMAEHHDKRVARDAAHQKVKDWGMPMSGDDIGKMGNARLVKNVIRPDGVQQGQTERIHDVPAGVHLATNEPFEGYTGDIKDQDGTS